VNDNRALVDKLLKLGWTQDKDGNLTAPKKSTNKAGGISPGAEPEQDPGGEALGPDEREEINKVRRIVRITSYRRRLIDGDNLFTKHFTDSIATSGLIVADSVEWARVENHQVKVHNAWEVRTEIEIEDDPTYDDKIHTRSKRSPRPALPGPQDSGERNRPEDSQAHAGNSDESD